LIKLILHLLIRHLLDITFPFPHLSSHLSSHIVGLINELSSQLSFQLLISGSLPHGELLQLQ